MVRPIIINVILFLIVGVLAFFGHQRWQTPRVPAGRLEVGRTEAREPDSFLLPSPTASPLNEYAVIAARTLFRPQREEYVPPTRPPAFPSPTPAPKAKKRSPPRLVLYGTVIVGEGEDARRIAIIEAPARGKGSSRARKSYGIGESVGGQEIVEILKDRVLLTYENKEIELLLRDPDNPKQRPLAAVKAKAKLEEKVLGTEKGEAISEGKAAAKRRVSDELPTPPPRLLGEEPPTPPERVVIRSPEGEEIVKIKRVIQTPFGPKTIYVEER